MLSLWANWLQLNSQLNSWGVSFCLYRRCMGPVHFVGACTFSNPWLAALKTSLSNRGGGGGGGDSCPLVWNFLFFCSSIGIWVQYELLQVNTPTLTSKKEKEKWFCLNLPEFCLNFIWIITLAQFCATPTPPPPPHPKSHTPIWMQPWYLKEEIQTRFNLISEERVKIVEQNTENLMKIGWKIRKLWHFEVSQFFKKHFLTSRYEYANEWVDDVIASQFSIHFIHRNDKNFIFHLWVC